MSDYHYPSKPASPQEAAQRATTLLGHLQEVTETLAATSDEEAVFRVILHPALQALGAEAGTVLLLEADHLRAVAAFGQENVISLWQDGPLSMNTPTADVMTSQSPLFFGHADELLLAYPALEERTGGRATVANAVLPLLLEGRSLGVVVLDFLQAHDFLEVERRFLRVLCAQCAIALGRIRQRSEQDRLILERTAALSAFAALTEAVGSETDLRVLALRAVEVLQKFLPELSVAYIELQNGRWEARVLSDDIPPEIATDVRAGYVFDTPILLQATQARTCTFIDGFGAVEGELSYAASYGALAFYPYFQGGQPSSMLVVGKRQTRRWTDAGQAMVSAVGRSLDLALERAEYARQKEAHQLAVLEARSHAEQAQREAEQQRSYAETMAHLAHHDALTGVLNRAGLSVRLGEAISLGAPFALFFLDLDGFKAVNDTLGHAAGDALLIQIAAVLHREVTGTYGEEQMLARIGGDEFTVMVSGMLDEDRSAATALGMRSALDQPFRVAGQDVFVSASTGIAVFPGDGETPEELLKNADLAMYQVKRESKNGWRRYLPGMNEEARARLLTNGLRGALERAGLEADSLEIELTERGVLADLPAVLEQFRALRTLGVRIALDDFGAGESNLGRLLHLPFDVLKLDRNLTATLGEQPEARRFMRALQIFATSLNLELVAEGIETQEQLEAVHTLGCHRAQGYLLGRPAAIWPPPDEASKRDAQPPRQ